MTFINNYADDPTCIWCNGSGEGQYDGTKCNWCNGSGVEKHIDPEAEDIGYDDDRQERIDGLQ